MDRARPDGEHAVHAVKIAFDLFYILHGRHADGRPDVPHDGKAGQGSLDPLRSGERLLVRRQQEPGAEAVFLQESADLGHKPAADGNIPDGAFVFLPAGAVLIAVDQCTEISHGVLLLC